MLCLHYFSQSLALGVMLVKCGHLSYDGSVGTEYFLFCSLELGENSGLLQPRAGADASKF